MTFKDRNFEPGNITIAKMVLTNAVDSTNLADDTIGVEHIATAAVTVAKLNTTLKTGFIPLDISTMRIITANEITVTTEGGVPDGDTNPKVSRINAATDKAMRVSWAAGNVAEVQFAPFALPPDLDSTAALTVKLLCSMAGTADTPTIAISYFEGVGDTNAGGATAAVTGTTPAVYSFPVVATDVGAVGAAATIGLIPGTHNTDILRLDGAWVEYTRV